MAFNWDELAKIDKQFIFKKGVTQEAIFEKYLGLQVDENEFYTNPLRGDDHPGCKFFYQSNNRLWFVDFAGRSYDCFNVVEIKFRCNYYTACRIIASDFGLLNLSSINTEFQPSTQQVKREKQVVTIRVKQKKYWTKEALAFWEKFKLNLSRDELINELHIHGVYPLDAAWLEYEDGTLKQVYDYNKYKPAYYYQLDSGFNYQLYFPYNPKDGIRFLQSGNQFIHFYKQLPERGNYIVVTKSRKDSFLLRQFGVNAIGIMSERGSISKDIMVNLQLRFHYIFTLFDNDRTGIQASIRFRKQHQTIPLLIMKDSGKDFADLLLNEGVEFVVDLINELKQQYQLW